MPNNPLWNDEYRIMLMQIYLKKPKGMKPAYHPEMVDLAIHLHIEPKELHEEMRKLEDIDIPSIKKIWETYAEHPKKLNKAVRILKKRRGFNHPDTFFHDVPINESFEYMFKPVGPATKLTPVTLILILELYFKLIPMTMVAQTPEVKELAKLTNLQEKEICRVLQIYQHCDPCLHQTLPFGDELLTTCMALWKKYVNNEPKKLKTIAADLREYFQ